MEQVPRGPSVVPESELFDSDLNEMEPCAHPASARGASGRRHHGRATAHLPVLPVARVALGSPAAARQPDAEHEDARFPHAPSVAWRRVERKPAVAGAGEHMTATAEADS